MLYDYAINANRFSGFLQPNNCKDSAKYQHSKALSLIFYIKKPVFMSSCLKKHVLHVSCKYHTKGKNVLQNKNLFQRFVWLFLWGFASFLTLLFLKRACFPFQYSHCWKARVALLHDNRGCIGVIKWLYSSPIVLVQPSYSLHTSCIDCITICASARYRCTLKT